MTPAVAPAATRIPFVDLTRQLARVRPEIDAAMARVLDRADFISGQEVAEFEREFAAYCGCRFGVAVGSGTEALHLAIRGLAIRAGDEVITAANTFIATVLAISHAGARPVLVDIDPATNTLDPRLLEAAITPRTRAIVPVHLYGTAADLEPIVSIAQRHQLGVVEDASQAHGASYAGRRVGAWGDCAAFSLYPTKPLGALGDAGIVVTNDQTLAEPLRLLRNYGQRQRYHHDLQGFNSRLDTLQAAALRVKLRHLDTWNAERRERAERYRQLLAHLPLGLPQPGPRADHVYHLFAVRTPVRDALREHLAERGIATLIHYPMPLHLQPAYAGLGYVRGTFPQAEAHASETLSLPIFAELEDVEIEATCRAIASFFEDRSTSPQPPL